MTDEGYNGWKNYPTWAVHLWLTNDESSYDDCLRTAGDAIRHSETPRVYLADTLKESTEENMPGPHELDGGSMYRDLLGYALDCVDWFEIADAFLADESLDATKMIAAKRA